jgi:hypothetical protein
MRRCDGTLAAAAQALENSTEQKEDTNMSTRQPEPPRESDARLNPALHREIDASHGTEFRGTDPMKTVSVQDPDEGRSWPLIWAIVAILCAVIAVYYIVT